MNQITSTDIRYLRNYPQRLKEIIEDNQGRRTEEYDDIALEWIKNARPYRTLSSFGKMTRRVKDKLNQLYEKIYKQIDDSELERDIPYPKELDIQKSKRLKQKEVRDAKKDFQLFSTFSSSRGFKPPRPTKEDVYSLFPKVKYSKGEITSETIKKKKMERLERINYGRERPESIKEFVPQLIDAIQSDSQDAFNRIIRVIQLNPPISLRGLKSLMKIIPKKSYYYYALDELRGKILNPNVSFIQPKSNIPSSYSDISDEEDISEYEEEVEDEKTKKELKLIYDDLYNLKRKR
jgi:hypothetical protein